jgi:hypothetical protein
MNLFLLLYGMLIGVTPPAVSVVIVATVALGYLVFGVGWALDVACDWLRAVIRARFPRFARLAEEEYRRRFGPSCATFGRRDR